MPGFRSSRLRRPAVDVPMLVEDQRPRADEAHLAPEHVDELRQLVERVAAQKPPDARHPRVVGDLEHARVAARRCLFRCATSCFRASASAAIVRNLRMRERLAAAAHPHLPEEDRPARVELDRDRDGGEERRQQDERRCPRATRSSARLRKSDERREPRGRQPEQRQPLGRVDAHMRAEHVEQPRHDVDLHVELVELRIDRASLVRRLRERHDHALDVERVDRSPGVVRRCRAPSGRRALPRARAGGRRRSRRC